jgi:tetratricopeptide (TPR) repeat protein
MQSAALSEAETQYYEGELLLSLRQIPEAKALLEKSVALDSHNSHSLVSLGIVRLIEQRPEEGEKLFQSALEADSGNYLAHYYHAETLARHQRYEEAIKSYKQAIALKPDLANLFVGLGYAYLKAGNEDEAIKTFQEATRVNPREGDFYRILGYAYLNRREGDSAANNAYNYLRTRGWHDEHSRYMVLVWYFGLRQAKHDAFAIKTLQESIAKVEPTDWPYPVMQFLNHTLTLAEMLAQANDNDKLTEAHAYAGLAFSLNGEIQIALEHLRWVKDNGNKDFVEYPLALAEIARLEGAAVGPK